MRYVMAVAAVIVMGLALLLISSNAGRGGQAPRIGASAEATVAAAGAMDAAGEPISEDRRAELRQGTARAIEDREGLARFARMTDEQKLAAQRMGAIEFARSEAQMHGEDAPELIEARRTTYAEALASLDLDRTSAADEPSDGSPVWLVRMRADSYSIDSMANAEPTRGVLHVIARAHVGKRVDPISFGFREDPPTGTKSP